MFTSCGAGGNKQQQAVPDNENIREELQKLTSTLEKVISDKPQELASTLESVIDGIKYLNKDLVKVNNPYADVYSLLLLGRPTVCVIFNSNNTKNSMLAFIKIIDETAEKLVQKYQDHVYYAFDNEGKLVLAYQGNPSEHIFSVEGYHFYVNGSPSEMGVDCPFRNAYADIVKEKRRVKALTEWDYYMFRNRMPFDEKQDGGIMCGPVAIGTSALMEVAKTDWNLILNMRQFETFIEIFENREGGIQAYIEEQGNYGIVWFDNEGKRVMAEMISGPINKRERERKWYNGYKMP
jgi:hypothetical protein